MQNQVKSHPTCRINDRTIYEAKQRQPPTGQVTAYIRTRGVVNLDLKLVMFYPSYFNSEGSYHN